MLIGILALTTVTMFMLVVLVYLHASKSSKLSTAYQTEGQGITVLENSRNFVWYNVLRSLSSIVAVFPGVDYFDKKMVRAGILLRGSEFVVLSIGLSLIVGGVAAILLPNSSGTGVGAALLSFCGIMMFVYIRIKKRQALLEKQLEEALGLMAGTLRSGMSILQAVEMVATEIAPPLSQEFIRLTREISYGVPVEEAFTNLADRVKTEDMEIVVTAILIQRQIGGNLAILLDNVSRTIRERRQLKNEIRMLTAQGRLSGWIIGLMPFAIGVLLCILMPEYMTAFFSDSLGRIVIGIALVCQWLGLIVIRNLTNIDI